MGGNSDDSITDELLNHDMRTTESPEETLINEEQWKRIELAFTDFKDEYVIFSEWLEGSPPRIIAESFEIPVSDINNVIRKGKRIVNNLFPKKS